MPEPGSDAHLDLPRARLVCADCPVRDECLEHALGLDEPGVWGGTKRKQRREMRFRRSAARVG